MTTKVSNSYLVREADLDSEREQILHLWRHLPSNESPRVEKLDWFYLQNPAGKGVAYALVFKPENRIVGVILAGRRDFRNGKNVYNGVVMADFVIEPAHRSLGPGLMLQRYVAERISEDFDLSYGFPGKRSGRLRQFSGFSIDGDLDIMVLPLRPGQFMRRYLPEWLAKPICFVMEIILRYFLLARTRAPSGQYGEAVVNESFINQLSQRFNSDDRVVGVRDWSFVNWRVLSDPFTEYFLYGISDKAGNAAAYLAYKTNAAREVVIVDFHAVDTASFSALLAHFIRENIRTRSTSISITISKKDASDYAIVERFAFWQRKTKKTFTVIGKVAADHLNSESVHLNLIDNDV